MLLAKERKIMESGVMKMTMKIGTRSSSLARIQAESVCKMLSKKCPAMNWALVASSSPGDRDKKSDLLTAPDDFFTRDLDDALLAGALDCAVHSAKDLPDPLPSGTDWFWLPQPADPRDVLVGSLEPTVIGVSSERRIAYARQRFPDAEIKPLRGTIEERIAQLDAGAFDCILMAAAALQRLGLEERIAEWISLDDLPAPAGQGVLALTFRADDERFLRLRTLFVSPVVFVSAGTSAGLCTQAGIAALRRAEVCLYDALLDDTLLQELPPGAQKVFVGKRSGQHSRTQDAICDLLVRFARQGKRVVRLKGGDAGLYGRLAEEVDALDALQLPYRVIPGVSTLSAATTGTGLLLTRRGVADHFRVFTGHPGIVPGETRVVFMGIKSLEKTVAQFIQEGLSPDTPASVVFGADGLAEQIVSASLETIVSKLPETDLPGLVLIGETAAPQFLYRSHGALRGKRIWLTCSAAIQERAAQAVLDFGGVPVQQPLIELVPEVFQADLEAFDWLIVTSPSAVRCLMSQLDNLRTLPKILCCGTGTAKALNAFCIQADAMPEGEYNSAGVLNAARTHISREENILRVRSDRAGETLSNQLRETFEHVNDVVICRNQLVVCDPPACDEILFASVSAVDSFVEQFGPTALQGKELTVIGKQDEAELRKYGIEKVTAPERSTVEGAVEAMARRSVQQEMER